MSLLESSEIEIPLQAKGFTNSDILIGKRLHPAKVIKTYDSSDFELFIHEWAYGYLKDKGTYKSVYRIGGSGDKGRDVIAYVDEEKKIADYFQCKHYSKALAAADVYVEIGKLCYNTYRKNIVFPRKYYFLAPKDVTSNLLDLLHGDKDVLRKKVLENWSACCEKSIAVRGVSLDEELSAYIAQIDFGIFDTKPILEVIDEHSKTRWHAIRFGGGLRVRPDVSDAPTNVDVTENPYVEQLFDAYSERENAPISSVKDLGSYPKDSEHFKRQRNAYYSAEALRIHARDTLPPELDEFGKFTKDVLDGVTNTAQKVYPNKLEKIDSVTDRAMRLPIEGNMLSNQIRTLDKHGACHHLVNEGKIDWK